MRLIDADALPYKTHKWRNPDGQEHEWNVVDKYDIDNAPTIEPYKSTDRKSADVPSGDLISRADALEQMAQAECGLHYEDCEADNCFCSYIQRILDLPPADRPSADVVHKPDYSYEADMVKRLKEATSADKPNYNLETIADIVKQLGHLDGCIADILDRQQGEWIMHIDDLFPEESTQECSNCHEHENIIIHNDNFCPNCGARMKGGAE